jgi:hypothetical protein
MNNQFAAVEEIVDICMESSANFQKTIEKNTRRKSKKEFTEISSIFGYDRGDKEFGRYIEIASKTY